MKTLGSTTLYLGPGRRGAPDSIRDAVESALGAGPASIMSQQFADEGLVTLLAELRHRIGASATLRVLIERDYLVETPPVEASSALELAGRQERNRQCLTALLRSDIDVRFDHVRGDLQHVNLVVGEGDDDAYVFLTSANFSTGSLDRHLNWAIRIDGADTAEACAKVVEAAWDGNFHDATAEIPIAATDESTGVLSIGANGEATRSFTEAVNAATSSVRFAYFNASRSSAGVRALLEARQRGVEILGVVDGDQGHQSWDAAKALKDSECDVRYYPGALTGAVGRMHHKLAVIDETVAHLSTANLSASAESSLEAALTLSNAGDLTGMMTEEIRRLHAGASDEPLPELLV